MKNTILIVLLVCGWAQFATAQNQKETVLFDYDQFVLTANAKAKLEEVVSKLDLAQLQTVVLNGNTDADGDSKYNITLSKNRANEVLNYLVAKGISAEKIELKFEGENKPVAENASDKGKQQNRRVEITFVFAEKEYTNTIFNLLKKESQFFTGKSNEVITITGKEGTKITIPKNSLMKPNGKYAIGKIDIELQEFYQKSDAVAANLHTMSDGIMLESGGMIYIKATSKGEELQLKKGAEMTIEMASKNNPSDMQTFYGYPKKDKTVDWSTDDNYIVTEQENWTTYAVFYWDGKEQRDTIYNGKSTKKSFKRATTDAEKVSAINTTILQSTKLGWINCDRFYEIKDKTDLFVDVNLKYKPEIRLVFKDINSIMSGHIDKNNKLVLGGIPLGRTATLMAFSCVDNEVYFAVKEIVINKNASVGLDLRKTSVAEFKTALQQLN
ncbi:OmpA family protein [Flavobacterium sp. IMCC34852]|uniref:OmpA family protein n=1 Tax=Flavobacterium rivulicola TaxID=2732161 RepID=A0A7Y3R7B6_9FLAO|nr:OmpA family protein [Flavobacterium sp. IMCC34852]NNT70881.1 OmpA family protein [Flavobacterium sp. IMCC34852]